MTHKADVPGSIAARLVGRVADFVARRGHDAEALCREAGVTLAGLRDPEARLPYALAEELGERAARLTKDDNFGLHLAQDVGNTSVFDAGVLMLMASPTVRAALERLERHQRYWGDGQRCTLVPRRGGLRLQYALPGSSERSRRHVDECALAEVVIGLRFLSGVEIAPASVYFRHSEPKSTVEHVALFQCPLEFDAPRTELALDDSVLTLPLRHANEAYCDIFQAQVERALERLPSAQDVVSQTRAVARAALTAGQCSLSDTARVLGLSSRTLQRRLAEEGVSFSALIESLRRELAGEYLDKGFPVVEIASLLGYAEVTAFQHAFRRWTGTSPEKARADRTHS